MNALQRRVAALEKQAPITDQRVEELTPDEVLDLVFGCVRDALIRHDGQQWQPTYYTTELTEILNDMARTQAHAVFLPLRESERLAALEALAAGRFDFARNYPPYDKHQPKDCRTGTPILRQAVWSDREAYELSCAVHRSAFLWHSQTGEPMPATLDEFGRFLQAVEHLTPLP